MNDTVVIMMVSEQHVDVDVDVCHHGAVLWAVAPFDYSVNHDTPLSSYTQIHTHTIRIAHR